MENGASVSGNVAVDYHPSLRHRCDLEGLLFEFIDELPAQTQKTANPVVLPILWPDRDDARFSSAKPLHQFIMGDRFDAACFHFGVPMDGEIECVIVRLLDG